MAPHQSSADYVVRDATPDDAERAAALIERSFLTLGADGWSDEARDYLIEHTSADALREALAACAIAVVCEAAPARSPALNPALHPTVIGSHDDSPAGNTPPGDTPGRDDPDCEDPPPVWGWLLMPRPDLVGMCFVDPGRVRQGIGTALWTAARQRLAERFPAQRSVELNATAHAVPAYRRWGFAPISAVYERGGSVATRMACWLPARDLGADPHRAEFVVRRYWALMASNRFETVGDVLAADFQLDWPQSGERIRGAAAYARMNAEYPAQGAWRFHIRHLLVQGDTVHTEVDVTDGAMRGRALSRFHLRGGLIHRIVEYWPDPFPAPAQRAQLVERVGDDRDLQLVWPAAEHLAGYTAALERGWSADTVRGPAAAAEELARIRQDPAAFLSGLVDREAAGGPVTLPDGRQVPRLPGFRRWLWDGEFCGSINFRWQPGTEALPPHVLGHIGYAVVPWKSGAGYATRALGLLLDDVRAEGLRHVILTTDHDNRPSQRVIEANGGRRLEAFRLPDSFGGGPAWRYRIDLD